MSDNLISIIVPVYNVEKYLDECLKSLINQTYKNIEILLVNDGSTDNSRKICEKYVQHDSRIKILDKVNGGLSDARNVGIEHASGEYLTFVDSDDVVDTTFCERLLDVIRTYRADVATCSIVLFADKIPHRDAISESVIYRKDEIILAYLKGNIRPTAWGKLYRRRIFNELRYPVGKTTEDVYVIVELLLKADIVVTGAKTNLYYRQRRNSIQNSNSFNTKDMLAAHKRNVCLLENSKFQELAYERYILAHLDAIDILIRNGVYDERFEQYRIVLRNNIRKIIQSELVQIKRKIMFLMFLFCEKAYIYIYYRHTKKLFSNLT